MSFSLLESSSGAWGRGERPRPPVVSCPCPVCGRETKAAETRGNRRRRVCEVGHSHHTQEISEAELQRYAMWERVEIARDILREKGYLQK